jgi:hypothetical protein
MNSDGIRDGNFEEPQDAGEASGEAQGEKRKGKEKANDDSMMEVDGTNSQSTRGTKRKDVGKPDGNDSSEEPDDGEPNKEGNKNNDEEDDLARLAREADLLRALLQMAINKEAVGCTTLMGTMNQVSVIWNFIAIKLTS